MRFEHTSNGNEPQVFDTPLESVTIGRPASGVSVDLDLTPDIQVSRPHARLGQSDGHYWIEDLNSKHGTFVNGQRIGRRTRLTPQDSITVGRTTIRLLPETTEGQPHPPRRTVAPPVAPPAAPPGVPDATGSLRIDARQPPFEPAPNRQPVRTGPLGQAGRTGRTDQPDQPDQPDQARQQLHQFYTLSQVLGVAVSPDEVLHSFVIQVRQAFPQAHRGAVLLLDEQGTLLLKDHWPPGQPSVSITWARRVCTERAAFLWSDERPNDRAAEQPISATESIRAHSVRSTIYAPLLWREQVLGVVYVDNSERSDAFHTADVDLLRAFADQCALHLKNQLLQQELRREAAARRDLLRQFPPALVERMLREQSYPRLSGEHISPVTVLISDVRGFTALSATMEPNDIVRMLNEMFSTLTPIIFRHSGIVDKYIGDGLLAVFGSPEPDPHQCEHAIRAALDMQQAMHELASRWQQRNLTPCQVGIGIHTGAVVHGFIGSPERMEYTVIGDTVNRAARHCDGAARGEIVISRSVYERVFKLVGVKPTSIITKHPDREPDIAAYIVTGLKQEEKPA
jgi:adenylate cyclase